MALAQWLRGIDRIVSFVEAVSGRSSEPAQEVRGGALSPADAPISTPAGLGQLEARLAGVVVAALQQAFTHDRTRLDLERQQLEADQRRAEQLLRMELARQAHDRALQQTRMIAMVALIAWVTSAILAVLLPSIRQPLPRTLLAVGWLALIATLAGAFVAHGTVNTSPGQASNASDDRPLSSGPEWPVLPWLLVAGLAFTAASLIIAL